MILKKNRCNESIKWNNLAINSRKRYKTTFNNIVLLLVIFIIFFYRIKTIFYHFVFFKTPKTCILILKTKIINNIGVVQFEENNDKVLTNIHLVDNFAL